MGMEKFDALSESDKKIVGKLVFKDLIVSSLLTFQYLMLLVIAMLCCALTASVAALSVGAHVILVAIVTIGIYIFAKKHIDERRKALSAKIHAILKSNN